MHNLSDQELVKAYQSKLNNAYVGVLYKRYMGMVYGVCYKYLENHHDAEDATVNIFFLLLDKLKDNQINYFKSWLYVVSKNYLLSQIRKKKNISVTLHEEMTDHFMENESEVYLNIDQLGLNHDSDHLLKLGLESLKEAQQICLELFYLQKKSYVQVAEATGFEVKQVKSHIQNGKRNLKSFLQSKGYRHG